MKAYKRLLKYVAFPTASDERANTCPSTEKQFALANYLAEEMREMGLTDVTVDKNCYVYATLEANTQKDLPVIGFIAHLDTSPDAPDFPVNPRVIEDYDGKDILLNEDTVMKISEFPFLEGYKGKTLIVTDGNTLLGADDKAGIADILTAVEMLISSGEEHGKIRIAFTPDEEIGAGADLFDVKGFGADWAYTVDGGALGEIEYECFNASHATVTVTGRNIHPGSAKGKMINSILLAMEYHSMLPVFDRPENTEGYEGFIHLNDMSGDVEKTVMDFIIRDHDAQKLEQKKAIMTAAAEYMNVKYENSVKVDITDSYRNMKEMILPHFHIIEDAEKAMRECGVEPEIIAIRGGTDGARLSFEGLPCPNICTGGGNFHGRFEFACAEDMEKTAEIIKKIITNTAK
ncbi:MAG: peptidase T [Clostridia bacterium]|nr:peptidase T [Clostridia bacterium]